MDPRKLQQVRLREERLREERQRKADSLPPPDLDSPSSPLSPLAQKPPKKRVSLAAQAKQELTTTAPSSNATVGSATSKDDEGDPEPTNHTVAATASAGGKDGEDEFQDEPDTSPGPELPAGSPASPGTHYPSAVTVNGGTHDHPAAGDQEKRKEVAKTSEAGCVARDASEPGGSQSAPVGPSILTEEIAKPNLKVLEDDVQRRSKTALNPTHPISSFPPAQFLLLLSFFFFWDSSGGGVQEEKGCDQAEAA